MRWKAEVHVWPHAGEKAGAGEPVQYIEFDADRITDAVKVATIFAKGIETNPAVWQAPIYGLNVVSS